MSYKLTFRHQIGDDDVICVEKEITDEIPQAEVVKEFLDEITKAFKLGNYPIPAIKL